MNTDDVRAELRRYIVTRFQVLADDPDFSDAVHLFDFGYIDSLGALELVTFVSQRFSVEVDPTDWEGHELDNIDSIARLVMAKQRSS